MKTKIPFYQTITLFTFSAFVISCGNNEQTPAKTDTADTTKVVKQEPPPKPVEKIDPNDSVFEWKRSITLSGNPNSFALFADGSIVVSDRDSKDGCLSILNNDGSVIRSFGKLGKSDSTFKSFPDEVVIGPTGNIYVVDAVQPRVLIFDSLGRFLHLVKLKGGDLVGGIAVNKAGTLFVSIATGWILRTYDAEGNYTGDLKNIKDAGGKIWGYMAGVAVDSSDGLYVMNWRNAGISNGIDVAMHECAKDGSYLNTIALGTDHNVVLFTADPIGRIFADKLHGVIVFGHDGRKIGEFGKPGKGDGCFEEEAIRTIHVTMTGEVYVMDKGRIQVFK